MRRVFKNWWFLTISLMLIVLLLLTFGLPIFVAFLKPLWVRLLLGALVVGIWALFAVLRVRKGRKASAAIAEELSRPSAADEEGKQLASRMKTALTALRSQSGRKRDYLYSRPWYVIIGPPGAGKTTALLNSGLRFPFAEQALKGVGGTRNLDFWFAEEAALVDTAGRYTTQDSDREVDSRGWNSFLSLLKKHRPLQPINGIIVAIAVDELIRSDRAAIDAHAAAVMRRLREIRTTLEVSAPVYVLLTKADLLAGFTEYFDDLDFEGRRAVLGSTLPFASGKPDSEALARAFDAMTQAVTDRQAKRLYEEVDSGRRSLLLGFPSQLQSLRARLMRFLEGAFVAADSGAMLRGFYLTSGVQEGAPLDRILSGMADVYDRPAETRPGAAGKAYFLNRLLNNVMFEEAGLVQMDPRARGRQNARLAAMMGMIGLAVFLTLSAWGVSFANNRTFQRNLLASSAQAKSDIRQNGLDLKQVSRDDPDLRQALPVLNALRALPQGYEQRQAGAPPLSMRFGLFQRSLSRRAEEAYLDALRRVMLPRLLLRLEQYMESQRGNPMALYEPLKVYLMLGGKGPLNKGSVESWVRRDWSQAVYPEADSEVERRELASHLKALLEDPNMARVWAGGAAQLNAPLLADVRMEVQAMSVGERAYAVMRQRAAAAGNAWAVGDLLSEGDAAAFANPQTLRAIEVPYFFQSDGYKKSYLLGLPRVLQDVKRDAWVLGTDAEGTRAEIGEVRSTLAGLYARDYIEAWDKVIQALQPADYFNVPLAYGAFTKSPSPLKRVLMKVRENTRFEGGASAVARRAVTQRITRSRMGTYASDFQAGRETGLDAGGQISSYFAELHDYVGDGRGQAPVDEFVAAVKEAAPALRAARSVGGGDSAGGLGVSLATAMARVSAAADAAPQMLRGFVDAAKKGGSAAQLNTATGAVSEAYANNVLPACQEAAQERYPFVQTAPDDASMPDVQQVFGAGRLIEDFVNQRLNGLLDTSGPLWRWNSESPLTASFSQATPEAFARARQLRDLLISGFAIKVKVEQMGSQTDMVEFSTGASVQRFDRNSLGPKPLSWSPMATPEAYVEMKPASGDSTAARRMDAPGQWALFKLIEKAAREKKGESGMKATFRKEEQWVTFLISWPEGRNPFSRDLWSFRCPQAL